MKLERGLLSFGFYITRKFYSFNIYQLINGYQRGQIMSVFLILSKGIIILILLLYNSDYIRVSETDSNLQILSRDDQFNKWQSYHYAPDIQSVSLILNLIVIFYLFISYIIFFYVGYFNFAKPAETNSLQDFKFIEFDEEQFFLKINLIMKSKIFETMSIYITLFQFILMGPILYYSVLHSSYPLAPLNFILSFISGILILDTDYNYSNETLDYLKRPYTKYNIIVFFIEIIAITMVAMTNLYADTLTIGIYFWLNGLFSSFVCPYYDYQTRFWNTFAYFYSGTLSITFFLTMMTKSSTSVPSLMILLYIPLFYKLAGFLCNEQDQSNYNLLHDIFKENTSINLNKIDRTIRLNFFKELSNYRICDSDLIDLYSNIIQKAQLLQSSNQQGNEEDIKNKYESLLLYQIENGISIEFNVMLFIKDLIHKISTKQFDASISVIYLVYLLEIVNCKRSYFLEYTRIRQNRLSVKEEQIILSIHFHFLKYREIQQKTQGYNNPFDLVYQNVWLFEDRIQYLFGYFDKAIQKMVDFISYLRQKQLEVQELLIKVTVLRKMQIKIRKELNELASINRHDSNVICLSLCYLDTLSFREQDLINGLYLTMQSNDRYLQKQTLNSHQRKAKNKRNMNNLENFESKESVFDDTMIFNKNCCVVFAAIDKHTNLVIKKATNNFTCIFELSQKEIVDKKIEILMPSNYSFIKHHRQYIKHCFESQNIMNNSMRNKLLFGQSSQGHIIPIYIDIRLIQSIETEEIGFSAIIYEIHEQCEYLLFNSHTLTFVGQTKSLQNCVFAFKQFIKTTDISQYFPFLRIKFKVKEKNTTVSAMVKDELQITNDLQNNCNFKEHNEPINTYNSEKYNNNFEYLLIVEQSNKLVEQNIENNNLFLFFQTEISIHDSGYQDIHDLYYLKITKIKNIQLPSNSHTIMKHLREDHNLYSLIYSETQLKNIQQYVENNSFNRQQSSKQILQNEPLISKMKNQNQPLSALQNQIPQDFRSDYIRVDQQESKNSNINNLIDRNPLTPKQMQSQNIFDYSFAKQIEVERNRKNHSNSVSDKQSIQELYDDNEIQTTTPNILTPRNNNNQNLTIKSFDNIQTNRQLLSNKDQLFGLKQKQQCQLIDTQRSIQNFSSQNLQHQLSAKHQLFEISTNKTDSKRIQFPSTTSNPLFYYDKTNLYESRNCNTNKTSANNVILVAQNEQYKGNVAQNIYNISSYISLTQQQKYFSTNHNTNSLQAKNKQETKIQLKTTASLNKNIKHKDQQLEESSTKSRESSSSAKKQLIQIIRSPTQIGAVSLINLIGILTFLVLFLITLSQFIILDGNLSTILDNLTVFDWPYEVPNVLNRLIKNLNFLQLERKNDFTFASLKDKKIMDDYWLNHAKDTATDYLQLLNYMETLPKGIMLFQKLSLQPSNFYLNTLYNPSNMTGISSVRSDYYYQKINSSLLYAIDFVSYYIYQQGQNPASQYTENNILQNIPDITSGLKTIQQYFSDYHASENNQIHSTLSNQILIILLLSAGCLMLTLPLYSYIQEKKNMFINLFCSFPIAQLQQITLQIKTSYYSNKMLVPHIKIIPSEITSINSNLESQNIKKQTLSTITKLPHFKYSLLILLVVVFVLISIYPVLNKIYIESYLNILNNNILMLQQLNQVRSFIIESAAMTTFGITMKFYPKTRGTALIQYIDKIRAVVNKTNSAIDQLNQVSKQMDVAGRYNQKDFDNFFFPLFQNDICSLLQNNPQYIVNATKFSPSFCKTIEAGFFQKGLKISFSYYTQIMLDVNYIIEINDPQQLEISKQELFSSLDLQNYSYLIDYLDEIINIMKYFLLDNSNSFYQSLRYFQITMLIFQAILLVVTFGFGWFIFSRNLISQITEIKHSLQVLNIDYLLDNNYILTFIKNNSKI